MSSNSTVMLKYEPTLAAADGSVEQLAARGDHPLIFSETAKVTAEKWVQLQYTAGDKVHWQTVGA